MFCWLSLGSLSHPSLFKYYVVNKKNNMHMVLLSMLTALGAYGGFPPPPQWWVELFKYKGMQYLALWVFVYQGNGKEDVFWSTVASFVVFLLMSYT